MNSFADIGTTMGGASLGLAMLSTVDWKQVPYGECVKIGVALVVAVLGYFAYRGGKAAS